MFQIRPGPVPRIPMRSSQAVPWQRWSILFPAAAVIGCSDNLYTASASVENELATLPPRPTAAAVDNSAARAGWTIREEFNALAETLPGGFAGVYFDADRNVVIVLTDSAQGAAATQALADTEFVRQRDGVEPVSIFDLPGSFRPPLPTVSFTDSTTPLCLNWELGTLKAVSV